MTSDFPLRESLIGLQATMLTKFKDVTANIEHRGAKGREREALIARDYLRHYFPATVNLVHDAEILDSEGSRSAECDIVIEDISTPPLYSTETFRIIPAEWAYGVIEVKSNLNSAELKDAQKKVARAKALKKLTYVPQTGDIVWNWHAYGNTYTHFPMFGMVLAYTSKNLKELCTELWELQRDVPIEHWVDVVAVLDRGLLLYANEDGRLNRPVPGCSLQIISSDVTLVPLTLVIQNAFAEVKMTQARLAPYIDPESWGNVEGQVGP